MAAGGPLKDEPECVAEAERLSIPSQIAMLMLPNNWGW
jgi:hypothetical protein